jgi:hypothetical protein
MQSLLRGSLIHLERFGGIPDLKRSVSQRCVGLGFHLGQVGSKAQGLGLGLRGGGAGGTGGPGLKFAQAGDNAMAQSNVVARYQGQGQFAVKVEARFFASVGILIDAAKTGCIFFEHIEHGPDVSQHVCMVLASQFRNLAAGEVLMVRSNSLIARCAQDRVMRLGAVKKMAIVAESFQPRLAGLLGIQGRKKI